MGVQQQSNPANKTKNTKPMSEARKIRKPLMERKRRQRINTCLNDLASLLVDAKMVKTEPGKATKLEKADILELTVKHIKNLKTQEKTTPSSEAEEDKPTNSYKEGFTKCMGMVDQTLGKAGKEALRQRLLAHLRVCLKTLDPPVEEAKETTSVTSADTDKEKAVPADSKSDNEAESKVNTETKAAVSKELATRLTLVPTRLPSGGVAFVIQGGIDPSFLLLNECKDATSCVPESVSPPPSPATCDSSTSSPSGSSTPSPAPSLPSTSTTGCTSCTVMSSQCPPTPPPQVTSNQTSSTNIASQTSASTANISNPQDSQPLVPVGIPSLAYSETHSHSPVPYTASLYPLDNPSPAYCIPSSSNQSFPTTSHIPQPLTHTTYPSLSKLHPQPIPHHPQIPHYSYNPPTPPPSISPHNAQQAYQYQYYQPVSSEEDNMDTDGLSEEEIDVDVENDVPYDLSMRRIWRYW